MKKKSRKKLNFVLAIFAVFLLVIFLASYEAPTTKTGRATDTINMSASITSTVSCSASPSTLSFGSLTLDSDATTGVAAIVDASGSNTATNLNASVTTSSSWVPGFTSADTAWGIKCPFYGAAASGLDSSTGYSQHEFSPSENLCRKPMGISGVAVGLGAGTIPTLNQVPTSQNITSRINAPTGTTPGSYWTIVTFTCSEITGNAAGLSFEAADIESASQDRFVTCDGSTPNKFVAQAGLGPAQATLDDTQTSSVFVCDSNDNCVAATVGSQVTTPGANCGNTVPPIDNTPNQNDIVCGEFTCTGGTLAAGPGQVLIQAGPLTDPAGELVQAYFNVTIA